MGKQIKYVGPSEPQYIEVERSSIGGFFVNGEHPSTYDRVIAAITGLTRCGKVRLVLLPPEDKLGIYWGKRSWDGADQRLLSRPKGTGDQSYIVLPYQEAKIKSHVPKEIDGYELSYKADHIEVTNAECGKFLIQKSMLQAYLDTVRQDPKNQVRLSIDDYGLDITGPKDKPNICVHNKSEVLVYWTQEEFQEIINHVDE